MNTLNQIKLESAINQKINELIELRNRVLEAELNSLRIESEIYLPDIIYAFCWKNCADRDGVISLFYNKKDAEDMINSFGNCSDNYCVKEMKVTK